MSKYRATPQNFLPPPRKSYIEKSKVKFIDSNNMPWLFHNDWPASDRPKKYKEWAIFQSDQWNSSWLIVYTTKNENMPQPGEKIFLKRDDKMYRFNVVKWYPSKRVCITYLLTINQ
jgi:hypothetical protein